VIEPGEKDGDHCWRVSHVREGKSSAIECRTQNEEFRKTLS
jgi:hypothetical protein